MSGIVIIGGGVSGLATAYFLWKRGIRSTVVEKKSRLGGLIHTEVVDGCRLEAGPDSFIATKPAVIQLSDELPALQGRLIGTDDKQRQVYIARQNRLIPLPRGMNMMVPGDVRALLRSPLLSRQAKRRVVQEQFFRPRRRNDDFSIAEFVRDHFDEEVLSYLTEPLLAGVYGGEAGQLSARSVLPKFVEYEELNGSLIRSVRRQTQGIAPVPKSLFLSFEHGMAQLIEALRDATAGGVEYIHDEVERVSPNNSAGWSVHLRRAKNLEADHLVFAAPAPAIANIVNHSLPLLAAELAAIPYSSCILIAAVYLRKEVASVAPGFGFLVPRQERSIISAATFIHNKFPSRIDARYAAIRAFLVSPEAETLMGESDEALAGKVEADLKRLLRLDACPRTLRVFRWPASMPQYVVGHAARIERIERLLKDLDGLQMVGNIFDGVGIPDCVRRADRVAREIALNSRAPVNNV